MKWQTSCFHFIFHLNFLFVTRIYLLEKLCHSFHFMLFVQFTSRMNAKMWHLFSVVCCFWYLTGIIKFHLIKFLSFLLAYSTIFMVVLRLPWKNTWRPNGRKRGKIIKIETGKGVWKGIQIFHVNKFFSQFFLFMSHSS